MAKISENTQHEIQTYLDAQTEWLLINSGGRSFSLGLDEIELVFEREKLLFSFLNDQGFQTWRVANYKFEKEKLSLELTRNFAREYERVSLVPRALAGKLAEFAELARIEKAQKIAKLIVKDQPSAKLIRVALNAETGRFAQIIIEITDGRQIAVVADVSGMLTPEILLTGAILWLEKLLARRKNPIDIIWILAEKKIAKNLQKLHTLLRESWKSKTLLKEISRPDKTPEKPFKNLSTLTIADLWREKKQEIKPVETLNLSETAETIISLAPEEIDVIFSQSGATFRFRGLPFARLRKLLSEEKIWFGIEKNKQLLTEKTHSEFLALVETLKTYRCFNSPNKYHEFYRAAPEAWLEAVLRKDVKSLDANLILSPLHIQFRADKDKIDLLALRRDGRVVIIELKVSSDREMIFQAADYWRKIELQRRIGNLQKAKIFGELEIKDEPPLVYLVTPMLSFHKDFAFFAKTISPEIEIYRFDLNEPWRESLKVLRRHLQ